MASEPSFRLIVRRGPQPNQIYELNKDVVTLGRDITNDIVVSDPEVSRHHSRLTRVSGGYAAEDLGSTNGTFVNGQRVTGGPRPLSNGDLLGVGETVTLAYEAIGAPSQVQPTMVGSGAPPPPPPPAAAPAPAAPAAPAAMPRRAPPMAEEEAGGPKASRTLIIGCIVVLALGCCLVLAAGLFLPSDVWCQIPIGNQFQVLCVP